MKKSIILASLAGALLGLSLKTVAQESQFIDFGPAPIPMGERMDPNNANGVPSNFSEEDELLFDKPKAPPRPRVSKLYFAVAKNDLVAVQEACGESCNINENFYKNNNILHLAASLGNLGMYQFGVDRGATFTANADKETPLHLAAQSGNVELVDYILSKTKEPQKAIQALNKDNQTPLFYAFRNVAARDLTGLYLLGRKADCNAQDKAGQTAMTWAMVAKNQASIAEFQRYGCDFFIQDKDGLTPAHMAVKQSLKPEEFQMYNKFLYSGITVADPEASKVEKKVEKK